MARYTKLFVSLVLFSADFLCFLLRKASGRVPVPSCVVVFYHGVEPDKKIVFSRQMETVKKFSKILPADFNGELEPGRHHAMVTFDDGLISLLDNAIPVLQELKIPATFFIPTRYFGAAPGWIVPKPGDEPSSPVMTEDNLRQLGRNPLFIIGSHSVTHTRFTRLDDSAAKDEFKESKSVLEKILGLDVTLFSFPHGAFNDHCLALAKESGYMRVFTISPQLAMKTASEFKTGRIHVSLDDSKLEFFLKLFGAYRWLAEIPRLRRILGLGD